MNGIWNARIIAMAFGKRVPVRLEDKRLLFAGGEVSASATIIIEWSGDHRDDARQLKANLDASGFTDVRLERIKA